MSGRGNGHRWRLDAADSTDDYRQIDVRTWQRGALLASGRTFTWHWTRNGETVALINVRARSDSVILSYRHRSADKDWKDANYPVQLDWTECNFGGRRAWFLCPASGCSRRVAILYGGALFACRHCYQLAYPSQREAAHDRAMRRAEKIRERLGWEPGILNRSGCKPKWMRWRTYERLSDEHKALVEESLATAVRRFGGIGQGAGLNSVSKHNEPDRCVITLQPQACR
jgi:hypothetical protein